MEKEKKTKGKNGGARPGAGRPKGSRNAVTIENLLASIEVKTSGRPYEDLLAEDFLVARANNDTQLMLKYHNLILNRVMHNLNKIEVTDSSEAVEAKQTAFAQALANLTGIKDQGK